jgi:hypothetical protein
MKAEIDLIQPLGMEQPIAHLLGEKSRIGRNPHVWRGALEHRSGRHDDAFTSRGA